MKKFNLSSRWVLLLIVIVTTYTFWDLPKTFYQQDEWQALGHNLTQGVDNLIKYSSPSQLLFAEGRPLNRALYLIFFGVFKFDVFPIAIFSIILHVINSFLVFYLVNKISGKKLIAFISSLFFAINSVSSQAVTWSAATITIPATTLLVLSILSYLKFLEKDNKKYLYLSFLAGLVSLFFKETGVLLFPLLPLMYIIYKKDFDLKKIVRIHLPLLIYGALMVLFRVFELFTSSSKVAGFETGGQNFLQSVILHSILYPLTSLLQVFVPPLDLYSFTQAITRMQYKFLIGSPLTDLVAQSAVTDMISIAGSMSIILFLFLIIHKKRNLLISKNIVFALIFFLLSFLPYAVLYREGSYLSSRYFYVGAIPAGVILGYLVYYLTGFGKYTRWIVLFLVFIFLLHHTNVIRSDINYQVKLGDQRKAVLTGIKNLYPNLEENSIFYITSDKGYYGEITNPFQNGLGYVLEVWYYNSGNVPKEFLSENFLWDLGAEGYKKQGDKGFGYYQNLDKMIEDMKKNKLKANIIHGFFIRSSDTKVLDITDDVRTKVSTISAIRK